APAPKQEAPKPAAAAAPPKPVEAPVPPPAAAPQAAEPAEPAGPLSPLVRKIARENNLDLSRVKGTGAGGRITKQDVESFMAQPATTAAAPQPVSAPQAAPAAQPAVTAPLPAAGGAPKTRIEPLSQMRARIAEHMVMS